MTFSSPFLTLNKSREWYESLYLIPVCELFSRPMREYYLRHSWNVSRRCKKQWRGTNNKHNKGRMKGFRISYRHLLVVSLRRKHLSLYSPYSDPPSSLVFYLVVRIFVSDHVRFVYSPAPLTFFPQLVSNKYKEVGSPSNRKCTG